MTDQLAPPGEGRRVGDDASPPVLVCVHGLSGSSRWWARVLPRLERSGSVVVLDVPRSLRPADLPVWVSSRLETLTPPVDLAGHSLGALVSAKVACSRPDLVRRLVLIAPPGIRGRRPAAAYLWPLLRTVATSRPRFLATLTTDALRTGPTNLVRGGLHVTGADVRDDLPAVVAPTLLVWGARDRIVPASEGLAWEERLADARLVVLPEAGHVPMVEAPEALAEAIAAFREERLDEPGHQRRM